MTKPTGKPKGTSATNIIGERKDPQTSKKKKDYGGNPQNNVLGGDRPS